MDCFRSSVRWVHFVTEFVTAIEQQLGRALQIRSIILIEKPNKFAERDPNRTIQLQTSAFTFTFCKHSINLKHNLGPDTTAIKKADCIADLVLQGEVQQLMNEILDEKSISMGEEQCSHFIRRLAEHALAHIKNR